MTPPIPKGTMAKVREPKVKVRCPQCGAKNDDIEMCRICGLSLPNAAEIRTRAGADGPAFKETVESERAAWREYSEGRTNTGVKSQGPEQHSTAPPTGWDDADAPLAGDDDDGPGAAGTRRTALNVIGLSLIVLAIVLLAALVQALL